MQQVNRNQWNFPEQLDMLTLTAKSVGEGEWRLHFTYYIILDRL